MIQRVNPSISQALFEYVFQKRVAIFLDYYLSMLSSDLREQVINEVLKKTHSRNVTGWTRNES